MKSVVCGMIGLCVAIASGGEASATTSYFTHGSNCFALNPSQVNYGQFGVNASTSATGNVMCPLPDAWNTAVFGAPFSIGFGGYDRSTTANVACSVVMTNGSGGINSIVSGSTLGTGDSVPAARGFTITGTNVGFTYLNCTIPGVTSLGASHLTGYTPML